MKRGFTLIELLIVVAIIAILAAIAVPNFLEAQTRSKVSRTKADMRSIVTGVETYYVDNNSYPPDRSPYFVQPGVLGTEILGNELSTPIAYLTSLEIAYDPFKKGRADTTNWRLKYHWRNYLGLLARAQDSGNTAAAEIYADRIGNLEGAYRLASAGPDRYIFYTGVGTPGDFRDNGSLNFAILNYDPTNGTVSSGDIFRTPRFTDGGVQPEG